MEEDKPEKPAAEPADPVAEPAEESVEPVEDMPPAPKPRAVRLRKPKASAPSIVTVPTPPTVWVPVICIASASDLLSPHRAPPGPRYLHIWPPKSGELSRL